MGRCASAPVIEIGHYHLEKADLEKVDQAIQNKLIKPIIPDYECFDDYINTGGYKALDEIKNGLKADKKEINKLVSIKSWASCGVDPALMGTGPIPSSKKALDLAGWNIKDVDLFEINEAFAAQSLAVLKTLSIPEEKVNVNGGAIALGHPIGASGTRILVTLIHEMIKRDVKKGLATLCIGGGMGIAMCVER